MTTADTQLHIDQFMASADPPGTFLRLADILAHTAKSDKEAHTALAAAVRWIREPGKIPGDRERHFTRLAQDAENPLGLHAPTARLLAVGYMRALSHLQAGGAKVTQEFSGRIRNVGKYAEAIDSDFLGDLLVETEIRRRRRSFAQRLSDAYEELSDCSRALSGVAADIADVLTGKEEGSGHATPRLRVSCEINGMEAPCGLVIAVIIIMIVVGK